MAEFCTQCGRFLADGEVCTCQGQQKQELQQEQQVTWQPPNFENTQFDYTYSQEQPGYNQSQPQNQGQAYNQNWTNTGYNQNGVNMGYKQNPGKETVDVANGLQSISQKIGKALDAVYDFITPSKKVTKFSNLIPVRNLLGFSKEDKFAPIGDCYERGKKIVPDLIQPCGQEIPIRQYELCSTRSLLQGLWQEGKLQVTNKRVLLRLSGRNWVGRAQTSIEFSLDEIAGMNIKNTNRLSAVTMMFNVSLAGIFMGLGKGLLSLMIKTGLAAFIYVDIGFSIALFLLAQLLVRKHYYFKLFVTSFTLVGFMAAREMWNNQFWAAIYGIVIALEGVYFLLASLKPSLDVRVMAKCADSGPLEVKRESIWQNILRKPFTWGMEVLPGKDAARAMDEVGTMITDIQKFGDFGIEKWKE